MSQTIFTSNFFVVITGGIAERIRICFFLFVENIEWFRRFRTHLLYVCLLCRDNCLLRRPSSRHVSLICPEYQLSLSHTLSLNRRQQGGEGNEIILLPSLSSLPKYRGQSFLRKKNFPVFLHSEYQIYLRGGKVRTFFAIWNYFYGNACKARTSTPVDALCRTEDGPLRCLF